MDSKRHTFTLTYPAIVTFQEDLTVRNYGRPGVAIARGVTPTAKGAPLTVARDPEAPSILNAETSLEPWFATYKKAPSGDTVAAEGVVPAGIGAPRGVKTPFAAAANAETLLDAWLAT